MDRHYTNLTDQLFLSKTAYDVILGFIDTVIFSELPKDASEEFNRSLIKHIYKENIDIVFSFAESPIEKIFLNSLLLQSLRRSPYIIKYTEPFQPVQAALDTFVSNYNFVMSLWEKFQEVYGNPHSAV